MQVRFRRTGERRYAITVEREGAPPLEMDPAPGFDPIMPHDLLHLIVESALGLRRGIFGQVAAGGDARTFRGDASAGATRRDATRSRRRAARRGEKLAREGHREAAWSERATYLCLHEWLARSADPHRRRRAASMGPEAEHIRARQPAEERAALTRERLDAICTRLDALGGRWADLEIGESFAVEWP